MQKITKLIVKICLKENKKLSREIAVPHDARGSQRALSDNKDTAEELSDFSAEVFTAEGT